MEFFLENITKQPIIVVMTIICFGFLVYAAFYYISQQRKYGSYLEFASKFIKIGSLIALAGLLFFGILSFTPYKTPPSSQVALVLGDTQNTPRPVFSKEVRDLVTETMLQHKGEEVQDVLDSIVFISAAGQPEVIDINTTNMKLRSIGNNSSNAERSAALNLKTIEAALLESTPKSNGANYLEAILKAKDNVDEGANILVIGSGLSDSGDLNFSLSSILTNDEKRAQAISSIREEYGRNYLDGYTVSFYGLGDTVSPQESLSTKQKELVREIYREVIKSLGGKVSIDTSTIKGESVTTTYVVGTTDTGCGDIGLVFNDDNLKFVSNDSKFVNPAAAKESLTSIKNIWSEDGSSISSIQIDGYIAHYGGGIESLSQPRADAVKALLVELGVPADKLIASGKGYGPYDNDAQNRIVKVTVDRNNEMCGN